MKITNKNLRAAKRRYNNYVPRYVRDFVWPQGFNGTSSSDFDHIESCGGIPSGFVSEEEFEKGHKDPYDNDEFSRSHDEPEEFTQNRTHKKSENDVCERESDPTSEST